MVVAAVVAPAMRPVPDPGAAFDLEAAVPAAFAGWRVDPDELPLAPTPETEANLARLYRQVVGRTYVNAAGETMMLTVAHGGDQSDALKAHRQEVCLPGAGLRGGRDRARRDPGRRTRYPGHALPRRPRRAQRARDLLVHDG
jgi:EpsI family protein